MDWIAGVGICGFVDCGGVDCFVAKAPRNDGGEITSRNDKENRAACKGGGGVTSRNDGERVPCNEGRGVIVKKY